MTMTRRVRMVKQKVDGNKEGSALNSSTNKIFYANDVQGLPLNFSTKRKYLIKF